MLHVGGLVPPDKEDGAIISSVVQTPGRLPAGMRPSVAPRSHAEPVGACWQRITRSCRPSSSNGSGGPGSRRGAVARRIQTDGRLRWTGHRMVKSGPVRWHRLAESEPRPFQAFSLGHRITTPPPNPGSHSSWGTPRLEKSQKKEQDALRSVDTACRAPKDRCLEGKGGGSMRGVDLRWTGLWKCQG